MKSMDIMKALDFVNSKYINEAKTGEYNDVISRERIHKNGRAVRKMILSPIAAILAVVILTCAVLVSGPFGVFTVSAKTLSTAQYPTMTRYPVSGEGTPEFKEQYSSWLADVATQEAYMGEGERLDAFIMNSTVAFLSGSNGENTVYSPLNIYMTLAMMAEISDGDTRDQILDALECNTIFYLRKQTHAIWNANYRNDGMVTSILSGSLWLRNDIDYNMTVINTLSDKYYASVFEGEMGSYKYDNAYRSWLNEYAGGMMADQMSTTPLHRDAVMSIASTIQYEASWDYPFLNENNRTGIFKADDRDIMCEYMSKIEVEGGYYWGDKFTATSKPLKDSGSIYFILPKDGHTIDELIADEETLRFIVSDGEWCNGEKAVINITIPRFDVSSSIDLRYGFVDMGITDCFDRTKADFSSLTEDKKDADVLYVSDTEHSVRVSVDEEGCTGTSVSEYVIGTQPPFATAQKSFTADRPFIFIITGADKLPLFIGLIYQPLIQ